MSNLSSLLAPDHLADIRRSGLTDETILRAGFQSVPLRDVVRELKTNPYYLTSAYRIPYPETEGYARFRCFYEHGKKGQKYLQPKESQIRVYFPGGMTDALSDPTTPLYIIEGEKKALRAHQEGLTCIGLGGIWAWKREGKMLPGFDRIAIKGREILIVPDNDWTKTPSAYGQKISQQASVEGLSLALMKRGAKVKVIMLPESHKKIGLDDYLNENPVESLNNLETLDTSKLLDKPEVAEEEQETGEVDDPWVLAREIFPRVDFPWNIFPADVADSFKVLAKSCATSPVVIPGASFCILASALGRSISISPKIGWTEPAIVWHGDIRETGEGKTPPARLLSKSFNERQKAEHERYDKEKAEHDSLPANERKDSPPPKQPRGFFLTELTLEGLRNDMRDHPTGGVVAIMDELSSFVNANGQYKGGKGNDRESWLKLHDGHPARVGRATGSIYIDGARPSVFGGIQPGVFSRVFQQESGLYVQDGTLFRFLLTFEPPRHYVLDDTVWSGDHREAWESILTRALKWSKEWSEEKDSKPHCLMFDTDAYSAFKDWRNGLDETKQYLHPVLRGFIPKAFTYAVRLAGIIHCLNAFHTGQTPRKFLGADDFERARKVVEFYLGQTVDVLQLFRNEEHKPATDDGRMVVLASQISSLRGDVDNGRLAVGYIMDAFNRAVPDVQKFKTPRAFGGFLRDAGLRLTDSKKKFRAPNGKLYDGVRCVIWDQTTEDFLKQSPHSPLCPPSVDSCGFTQGDFMPPKSPKSPDAEFSGDIRGTLGDFKKQSPPLQTVASHGLGDLGDKGDFVYTRVKCADCFLVTECKQKAEHGTMTLHTCREFRARRGAA